MSLESAVLTINEVLAQSPNCSTGLAIHKQAFGMHSGPSRCPEILALIHGDDSFSGYWYGHIRQHPNKPGAYVAVIVWSERLVNATTVPLFFRRFDYWIRLRGEFQPCAIQNQDDAYAEAESIEGAAHCLVAMIQKFSIDLRWLNQDEHHSLSRLDFRLLDIYAEPEPSSEGETTQVPMPMPLTLI